MNLENERKRRSNTINYLKNHGAEEGRDWRWGTLGEWVRPGLVDEGGSVAVNERLVPVDKTALPIMIRSSGVRLIGGPATAMLMDDGVLPAEMPFAIAAPSPN